MDNFRVIYRILRYLEKALDYDEPDMNCISAKTMAISERRWLSLLAMLAGENYIEVVCEGERWSQNSHVCFQCTTHP